MSRRPLRVFLETLQIVHAKDSAEGGAVGIDRGSRTATMATSGTRGRQTPAAARQGHRTRGARGPGMFFLRQVALRQEGGGEEFLRDALKRGPLDVFPWASTVDDRISAFTAGDRLPQVRVCLW